MPRLSPFLAALVLSTALVAPAGTANATDLVHFTLNPAWHDGQIRASFRRADRDNHNWSTSFPAGELAGLDLARLRAAGDSPVNFVIIREAGRLDCAGRGGRSRASGACSFNADQGFLGFLASRGMRRPTGNQAFGLMAVNARREMVDALSRARYPVPTADQLMGLTAVGVDSAYIGGLARVGYRPSSLDTLLQFRA